LAHELTHLALSQGTLDRAELWLQEGVAKREETRWREPDPFDDMLPPDVVAAAGIKRGLGRPLTGLGPSIAMLPSPDEAMVAFAEVTSFLQYWANEAGPDALPRLIRELRDAPADSNVDAVLVKITGLGLGAWEAKWREHLGLVTAEPPPELAPGGHMAHTAELGRRVRLGELLLGRGHAQAAALELEPALRLAPFAPSVRCAYVAALLELGDLAAAAPLVDRPEDVHQRLGRWWSLHGLLQETSDPRSSWRGIALDPFEPAVACDELLPPGMPPNELQQALCAAARRAPR
jgi:hypothetical protein